MKFNDNLLMENLSFLDVSERQGLRLHLNNELLKLNSKGAVGTIGKKSYNFSVLGLFTVLSQFAITTVIQPNRYVIGLSIIGVLNTLKNLVNKLTNDEAIVCEIFYNLYNETGTLQLDKAQLEQQFHHEVKTADDKEKLSEAIKELLKKGIIEKPNPDLIKFVDFYVFHF